MTHYILSSDGMVTALIGPFDDYVAAEQHIKQMISLDEHYADMDNVIIDHYDLVDAVFQDSYSPAEDVEFAKCGMFTGDRPCYDDEPGVPSVYSEDSEEYFDRYVAGDR